MTGALLTAVPPELLVFALALALAALPRRAGHAVGVVGSLVVCWWSLSVPAGEHVQVLLFGFEAVLFNVDVYSRLLGATFGFIAAVGVAYAFTAGGDRRQTAYALAYVGAGLGTVFAGDWLTLVVFWELMAICATILLWRGAADRRTGIRYAIYHELGGLALISGVLLHYASVGTFLFGDGITAGAPAVLVALGIGLNAGFLALHVWIVDAYPEPHVATSVVLAAITTKVGAYAIVRAFPDGQVAIAYVGGGMVLFGVTFAVLQTDMRRLLSYHIVSQVGYMVAGFGAGTALARTGALAHLVNNVLYKSLLFMVAGVLIQRTGMENLKKLGGLGRAMPATAAVFAVAALSIAGVPGFNGFVSKGMVLDGVQKAGLEPLWYALVVGGVGTVVSFSKFGYYAFLHGDADADYDDLGGLELGTLGAVAGLCLVFGLVPGLLFELLPAEGVSYAKPFAGKQFVKAGGVALAGVVTFLGIRSRLSHVTPIPDLEVVYNPAGRWLQEATVAGAVTVDAGVDRLGRRLQRGLQSLLAGEFLRRDGRVVLPIRSEPSIGTGVFGILCILVVLFAVLFL